MTLLLPLIMLSAGYTTSTDLAGLARHWLEPVSVLEKYCFVPADNDPNMLLKITRQQILHRVDMSDFNRLAQSYQGDPNRPSGYFLCPRCYDKLYHLPYPDCKATKGYKMVSILAKDLIQYQPCPVCLPPPLTTIENLSENNEPNGLNDPNILLLLNAFLQQIGKEDPNG